MQNTQMYTLDPLFDFQVLCDTDLGLYKLIKSEYYDRSVFDNYLFDSNDMRFVKTKILSRDHYNPLFIFCKKGIMKDEELDDLYRQFLDEEYEKIIDLSSPTAILSIASVSNSINKMVNVTILCKNNKEKEWISKYNSKIKCIIGEYDNFDVTKYDTLYIKDIYSLLLLNQESIKNKNIMFPRFLFNIETASKKIELPIIEVSKRYYKDNKFIAIDPYKEIFLPVSED